MSRLPSLDLDGVNILPRSWTLTVLRRHSGISCVFKKVLHEGLCRGNLPVPPRDVFIRAPESFTTGAMKDFE